MFAGNIKSAIASLRSSKSRTFLTMLGIIIGISSVITIVSLGQGLKHRVVGQIENLGTDVLTIRPGRIANKDNQGAISAVNLPALLSPSTLTQADINALGKSGAYKHIVPMSFVTSSVASERKKIDNAFVVGTSSDLPQILKIKTEYGGFFDNFNSSENVAVVGANLADQLFREMNPVGNSVNIGGEDFVVRGVLSQTTGGLASLGQADFNSTIFIPYGPAKNVTDNKLNLLQIMVKSKRANLDQAVAQTNKIMLKSHGGKANFSVLTQQEVLQILDRVISAITGFTSAIAAISLIVGGIGIMAILLASVSERTREIGIRKAVGATNRQILNQFLIEGLVISIGGGLIGVAVAMAIYGFLRLYTHIDPVLDVLTVLMAVLVSVAIGIVFSVAPAAKAARKDPITALRGD